MSEEQILALLKSINIKIKALQAQMIMFQEALQPDLEYTRVEEEIKPMWVENLPQPKKLPKSNLKTDTETKGGTFPPSFKPEVIIQDLEGITILKKLEKSYLVLKNGYTTIVAYSHLKSGDGIVEGFFGNLNDDIFDERRWILKTKKDGTPNLEWQPFIKEEVPPWEAD